MIIGISLLYWFSATTSYFAAIFGVIFRLSICDHVSLVMFAQTTENGSSRMYPAEIGEDDSKKNVSAGSDADHINSTSWINAVRKNSARATGGNEALLASAPAPPVVIQDE